MVDCVSHKVVRNWDYELGLRRGELNHLLHIQHNNWSETFVSFVYVKESVVEKLSAEILSQLAWIFLEYELSVRSDCLVCARVVESRGLQIPEQHAAFIGVLRR